MQARAQPNWDCPYLGYPIFASSLARGLLERGQARHSLEDCRILIWMNLQTVYEQIGFKSGQFQTNTPEDEVMVVHIDTTLKRVYCWLENECLPPRLENVSIGGSVTLPLSSELEPERAALTVH